MSSSQGIDPFDNLSEMASMQLRKAGWERGKVRCNWFGRPLCLHLGGWSTFASHYITPEIHMRLIQRWPTFDLLRHPAIHILNQLQGISLTTGINIAYPHTVIFEPDVQSASDHGLRLSKILDEWLIPIGEFKSVATLWAGDMGTIYSSGFVTPVVYCVGFSFGEAMSHLCRDDELPIVDIDPLDDPDNKFICPLESYPDSSKRITVSAIKAARSLISHKTEE